MKLDTHGFQLVRIHLAYRDDEKDILQIFAPIDSNGRICANEFYGHFRDGGETYPVIIEDDSTDEVVERYAVDWGWDDKTETNITFLPRRLEINQEVWREDLVQGERERYCYLIKSINSVPFKT